MEVECRVELFGGLRVIQQQQVTTRFATQKMASLLAYLALSLSKPQPREILIALLWPEMDMDAGRNNLSTLLSLLRRQVEPRGTLTGAILQANRQCVWLNSETVHTDTAEFDRLLQRAARATEATDVIELLSKAAALYQGETLPGCYDDWALQARLAYQERYLAALQRWSEALLQVGRSEEALTALQAWIATDPGNEEALRRQMRLLAQMGRAATALETYRRQETILKERLGVLPDAQTQALAELLRHSPSMFAVVSSPPTPVLAARGATAAEAENRQSASAPISHSNTSPAASSASSSARVVSPEVRDEGASSIEGRVRLPPALTRFFGRAREKRELHALLTDPDTRLVTLLGMGGVGKTRLATEAARQASAHFAGRVWFVSLADLPNPSLIPSALMNALDLRPSPTDPLLRVSAALAEAPTLLALDNMEHLLGPSEAATKSENPAGIGGQEIVRLLLAHTPLLTCLVTSRQALHLDGEQEYALSPLPSPDGGEDVETLRNCDSVALYADRARLSKADFALTAHNAQAIASLCRRLEGIPLAIEMAAAWIKTVSPQKMLERLESHFDELVSRRRDLPLRHRSLRATCEWSYDLLEPELQRAFTCLSIFRGGWTLEAAEAIVGADALFALAELQERSLILTVETADAGAEIRYRMLEPLREFGLEKLEIGGEKAAVARAHAAYFAALTETAEGNCHSLQEFSWLNTLKQEQDNVRAALAWRRDHEGTLGLNMTAALARFWELSGALVEGAEWSAVMLALPTTQARTAPRARALRGAGILAMFQADYEAAAVFYGEAYAIFEDIHDRKGQADALQGLGNVAFYEQRYPQARLCYEQCLTLRAEAGEERSLASICHSLGNLEMRLGHCDAARASMEKAAALRRKIQDRLGLAHTMGALGQLARSQEQYDTALAHFREILPVFAEIGIPWSVALSVQHIAQTLWDQGQARQSAVLLAAVQELRAAINYQIPAAEREAHEELLQEIRANLGAVEFARAWAEGRAMSEANAVTYALQG